MTNGEASEEEPGIQLSMNQSYDEMLVRSGRTLEELAREFKPMAQSIRN